MSEENPKGLKAPLVVNENDLQEHKFANVLVKELFAGDSPSISVARITLDGENEANKNTGSDMFYYVVEGEGKFIIDGQTHEVSAGSLVCIPKGITYQDMGKLTMISLALPKFNQEDVVFVENK